MLCLPWLRWSQPNLLRPIKVNLIFPVFYILATLFVTIVPMYASPVETGEHSLTMIYDIIAYTEKKICSFIGTFASEYFIYFSTIIIFSQCRKYLTEFCLRIRLSDDTHLCTRLPRIYRVEEQAKILPKGCR